MRKFIKIFGIFIFLSNSCLAEVNEPGNFKSPDAVQEVLAGIRKTANAAWWGFDVNDSTAALQGAVNSGASKIIVPYMGNDWIVRPVYLASNQEIVFEQGVVVAAKKGYFKGEKDCLFTIYKGANIAIKGYGATLKMRKEDYSGSEYKKAEWRHIILLRGATNIRILGLRLASSGGDGVCVGSTQWKYYIPCRDIIIRDCNFDDNYRQGISVGSVDTLRIDNCVFSNTSGTPPSAGIDFEPDDYREMLSNIVVSNCISENNAGPGFVAGITNLDERSHEISILFVGCHIKNGRGSGFTVYGSQKKPHGVIEFNNCICEQTVYPGIFIDSNISSPLKIRFVNCKLKDVATDRRQSPIRMNLNLTTKSSRIEFENCHVYDNIERPFLAIRNNISGNGFYDLQGDISVYNKYGAKTYSQSPFNCPSLKIKDNGKTE